MKNKLLCVLAFTILSMVHVFSQSVEENIKKETFIYSIKDQDTLRLDKYDLPSVEKEKPCVIFVFGGSFLRGDRAAKKYIPFFNKLVKDGYSVVSIDYRLGLKKAYQEKKRIEQATKSKVSMNPQQALGVFANTINMAVEDLYDATNYIVSHAAEWNIDKNTIIASGSSAGAITVLQGEYILCNDAPLRVKLPDNFRYAGIVAFAGAIFSTDGDLNWKAAPAPIQLFHGDADKNVPFDKVTIDLVNIGFYGSKHIADNLGAKNRPFYFYCVENADHEIAEKPMTENWDEIKTFLDKMVVGKQNLIINTNVKQPDKPKLEKNFTILDYMKNNGLGLN